MDWPFGYLSSQVTSVSSKDAAALSARFHKDIIYIPNGVGADFRPDMERVAEFLSGIGLTPRKYFIFVAERIEPTKGAHLAIRAVNQLAQETPLLVVGDLNQVPAYRAELQAIAGPRIHFHSLIQDPRLLFGLVANAYCLVFPSLVEAMSMVLLEAASIGAPILASDIPENRIVLGDGNEYFQSGNVASLTGRLAWMLENGSEVALKSKQTQERVHRLYHWDAIAVRYDGVYRQVVGHD